MEIGPKKKRIFFFFAYHFWETIETFSGSTKMDIPIGKKLKSRQEKIGTSDFAPQMVDGES